MRDIGGEVVNSLKKKKHKRSLGRDGGGSDNIRKSKDREEREERGKSLEIDERRRSVGSQHGRESLEREFGRESAERQHSPKSLEMREYESADRDLREWDSGELASVVVGQAAVLAGLEQKMERIIGQVKFPLSLLLLCCRRRSSGRLVLCSPMPNWMQIFRSTPGSSQVLGVLTHMSN